MHSLCFTGTRQGRLVARSNALRSLEIWQLVVSSYWGSQRCRLCASPRQGSRTGLPGHWQSERLHVLLCALPVRQRYW